MSSNTIAPQPAPDDTWHKILEPDELLEGRVVSVTIGHENLAVTNHNGTYGALHNACPHQGGPLGEGSIENGLLRCPWHGYDYDPTTGQSPPPFDDAPSCFAVDVRDDGVYVSLPPEPPRRRTVSDVLVETMSNWGVDTVFGMVGHSNLGFADALREAEERGDLRYVGVRHEGAAAFAATAYGKLTGHPAACFGIAGPGSTNMLTGLYDAKVDGSPVLAISGQVPSKVRGRGAFQDVDLEGAFKDVARTSTTVLAGSDHAELMTLACKTALVERDVTHLVIPDEVQDIVSDAPAGGPAGRTGSRLIVPPPEALNEAVAAIGKAKRPLFVLGQGARAERQAVIELAEQLGAPMVTTFKAKGIVADSHPLACGVLGRSGTPVASWFMNESDLIVAFGASFSNHTGISPYKPTVQIDDDPMALGRFHPIDVGVQGNVGVTAKMLGDRLTALSESALSESGLPNSGPSKSGTSKKADLTDEIIGRWKLWRDEKASRRQDDRGRGLNSALVFETMGHVIPADAVICVDVGNNTYSFGRYFEAGEQDLLMSGYLGSIGFALPAAMGAWAAVGPERKVISISGDGGLGQYAMELTTLVKYEMNITHVVLNNNELGKISKEQRVAKHDVWQTSLVNPSFADFAQLCGAKGIRVEDPANLETALVEAIAHQGPALVEIMTDVALL